LLAQGRNLGLADVEFLSGGFGPGSPVRAALAQVGHTIGTALKLVLELHVLGLPAIAALAARSLGVIIRGNVLEDIGGDGIKPWGSNGALVEHNIVRGGRMRCEDAAAGIWPWDCDDPVIQFNEVCGMHGIGDGQGFDSDFLCRRSIFQYNYSMISGMILPRSTVPRRAPEWAFQRSARSFPFFVLNSTERV